MIGFAPQREKAVVLKLAAEQRAHACSGDAEWIMRSGVGSEKKAVAEYMADGVRFDIAALGRNTMTAPLIPIRK